MSVRDSFKKGSLEMLILVLLQGGDKYGYEISQTIGDRSSSVITMPEGSLYPTLYRLEKEKCITSYKKLVGERRTRVYITWSRWGKNGSTLWYTNTTSSITPFKNS